MNCVQVLGTRKTQQVTVADSEAAQEAGVQSGGPFGALVDYFLNRVSMTAAAATQKPH